MVILEFFEHGDTEEALETLEEVNIGSKAFMIPKLAVEIALEHKPSHREMVSIFLADLYGRAFSSDDIARGEYRFFNDKAGT